MGLLIGRALYARCGRAPPGAGPLRRSAAADQRGDAIEVRAGALVPLALVALGVASVPVEVGLGQLGEEAARLLAHDFAEALLGLGVRQRQAAARTGDAHVEQAPLLLEPPLL